MDVRSSFSPLYSLFIHGETGDSGRILIVVVSGVLLFAIGASVCSGVRRYDCAAEGVFAGVNEKLSRGFASGGDIKFDMVGSRDMLGGSVDEFLMNLVV